MDTGAWKITVYGVTKVSHVWVTQHTELQVKHGHIKRFKTKTCPWCRIEWSYRRTGTGNERRGEKKVSQISLRMANAIYCSRARQRRWLIYCVHRVLRWSSWQCKEVFSGTHSEFDKFPVNSQKESMKWDAWKQNWMSKKTIFKWFLIESELVKLTSFKRVWILTHTHTHTHTENLHF